MAYLVKVFNPHRQFGSTTYSMTFEDTDELIPSNRWEKKYPIDATRTDILQDVRQTIRAYVRAERISWTDAKLSGVEMSIDQSNGRTLSWTL